MTNGKTRAEQTFRTGRNEPYGEFYNSVYKKGIIRHALPLLGVMRLTV